MSDTPKDQLNNATKTKSSKLKIKKNNTNIPNKEILQCVVRSSRSDMPYEMTSDKDKIFSLIKKYNTKAVDLERSRYTVSIHPVYSLGDTEETFVLRLLVDLQLIKWVKSFTIKIPDSDVINSNTSSSTSGTNNSSSNSSNSTSMSIDDKNDKDTETLAKEIKDGVIVDTVSDNLIKLEDEGKVNKDTMRTAASEFIKQTSDNCADALTKDITKSIDGWLNNSRNLNSQLDATLNSSFQSINNAMNPVVTQISQTTKNIDQKLDAFQKNNVVKFLQGKTPVQDTAKKLTELFGKAGIKGGDNVVSYISKKIVGTMADPDRLNGILKGVGNFQKALNQFQGYVNAIQATVVAVEKAIIEIKNAIFNAAEKAIKSIIKSVKDSISKAIGNLVSNVVDSLKKSWDNAVKKNSNKDDKEKDKKKEEDKKKKEEEKKKKEEEKKKKEEEEKKKKEEEKKKKEEEKKKKENKK